MHGKQTSSLTQQQGLHILSARARWFFIIVCHLQACSLKAALDVETLVGFAAIQNALVAAHLFSHVIQCLYDPQAEFLALLILGHGNVFNMPDQSKVVDKFALDHHSTGSNHGIAFIADHEDVVRVIPIGHEVVTRIECFFGKVADGGQYSQGRKEAWVSVNSLPD